MYLSISHDIRFRLTSYALAISHTGSVTIAATYFWQKFFGTIPLPPNGLSRKLKSESGKIGSGSSFFQAAKFSSAVPVRRSISVWIQTLCLYKFVLSDTKIAAFLNFSPSLFSQNSLSRYVILISWNNAWTLQDKTVKWN